MKNNNKGFSLVELIIVIAIMAVLVGVLAPTYMQYVEKSKKSNDVSTVDTIINAIEIAAIDPETQADQWKTLTVSITDSGISIKQYSASAEMTGDAATMKKAVEKITGSDVKFKHGWGSSVDFVATRGDYGTVTFAYGDKTGTKNAGTTAFAKYATSITKIS